MGTTRWMFSELSVDFKLELDHIPERLHAPAQDLLAVGLGTDALAIVAWKQELEYSVLVVEIPDRV